MSIITCPVCGNLLQKQQHSYICDKKHTFDIASKGYVNLLTANRKNSKDPGDNKGMVLSRHSFLNAGFYGKLSEAVNKLVIRHFTKNSVCRHRRILDSGCGEGYYIDSLVRGCIAQKIEASCYGIDISKEAIKLASSRNKNIFFAVASSFELPVLSNSVDCLLQVFSPCSDAEFHRVLREDGILIAVIPGRKHLFGLKEILYEQPYENDEMEYSLPSFIKAEQVRVTYEITLRDPEIIRHLFRMTPYYWRTSADKVETLNKTEVLETACEFVVTLYQTTKTATS